MGTKSGPCVEAQLREFMTTNFTDPDECRNLEQIRGYVQQICNTIQDLKQTGQFVPAWDYTLLSRYNARQNALILMDFRSSYR